jgi:hypothetical protein
MGPEGSEQIIRRVYEKARCYISRCHGSAQCPLIALQEEFDIENDAVFKAASGFSGGIGLMLDTCGALLRTVMLLGMK